MPIFECSDGIQTQNYRNDLVVVSSFEISTKVVVQQSMFPAEGHLEDRLHLARLDVVVGYL